MVRIDRVILFVRLYLGTIPITDQTMNARASDRVFIVSISDRAMIRRNVILLCTSDLEFDFFLVSLNKLLNKESSCHLPDTP